MNRRKKSLPMRILHRTLRRVLRSFTALILLALVYTLAVGYAPFARLPVLSQEARTRVDARVETMSHDIETADRAAILETRTEALDERIRLINQARRELILTTYDCRDGESTRDVLSVVLARADDGVKVRILVDGIAGRFFLTGNDVFRAMAAHENIEVRFYNPFTYWQAWKHMGRMHDKYLIADDLAYILGGRNTFDYFLGEYPAPTHSLDREALVYNSDGGGESSLFEVKGYFEDIWNGGDAKAFSPAVSRAKRDAVYEELYERREALRAAKPALFETADYAPMTVKTQGVWLIHNPTGVYAKQPEAFAQLAGLMRRAETDIVTHSPYVVLNDESRKILSDVAAKVPVTLMVNAVENGQNIVASSDYLIHRQEVLSTGIRILEYAGGDSYHGKSMAIDDRISIIGSFNLDLRSTYVDTELMLVIRSPEINARLRANMDVLHANCLERLPDGSASVPPDLRVPAISIGRRAAMAVLGPVLQLVRNIV